MFHSTFISLSFVALCFTQLQYGSADDSNKGILSVSTKSFNNGNLVYAVCDKTTPSLTQCTVVQKKYPKKENTRSCEVTLKAADDESVLSVSIGVSTLGKDKAVLFYEDVQKNYSGTTKVGTLDFGTCKLTEVKVPDDSRDVIVDLWLLEKLVTFDDDSFDILIKDPERFGDKYGKMTINGDGTIKSEPAISNFDRHMLYHQLTTIASRSPTKGFAFFRGQGNGMVLGIVKPDGTEKQLTSYTLIVKSTAAVNDNLLSACGAVDDESDISCSQYDENGNAKFTTNVANKSTLVKAIRNLSGGGMLVVLANPTSCDKQSDCNNESRYRIVKIAADGKVVGSAEIKEFNKASMWDPTEVDVSEDSEYCVAIIVQNSAPFEGKPTDYEILRHCVKENELTI